MQHRSNVASEPFPLDSEIVRRCVDLAVSAGAEIMRVYASDDFGAGVKADASPVTEADTRAEAIILAGLRTSFPDVPIIAEEEAADGRVPASSDRFFLVDPLDGTKEFISRNGEFTVNIGLIEDGAPVAGVVYAPATGDIFVGDRDMAYRGRVTDMVCRHWTPIETRPTAGAMVAVGSRSHGTDDTARWLERYAIERFVSRGSSLKFCLVASGEADVYPRLGRTMEWDTAAGDAILRAAGGIVTDLDGRPLTYNKRGQCGDVDFANCHFVAYGDRTGINAAVPKARAG